MRNSPKSFSALYPSKLGPVAAGPFLLEPDLTERVNYSDGPGTWPRPAGHGGHDH